MDGLITNIQRFSVHDGPGIRTTVFLSGCPLSCLWCHNPEAVSSLPEILFFHSQCSGCQRCVISCPQECFQWHDKTIFDSSTCNQCGICVDNCPVGALKWSCSSVTSDDILREVLRDEAYYKVSHGGITLSGGEPLHQIEFSREVAKKAKLSGLHVAIETSGCVATEKFLDIVPF
ncbi:MAG: glycyl-radical enzyme activating protein, partial [Bacteroidia bacterium]|nr:glycyl-radical enzyme activating protein [Bacteroidia bacterium]